MGDQCSATYTLASSAGSRNCPNSVIFFFWPRGHEGFFSKPRTGNRQCSDVHEQLFSGLPALQPFSLVWGLLGGGGGCWGVRSVPCRGSGIEDFAGIFSGRGMFHLGWLLGFSAGLWAAAVVLAWAVPGWSLGIVPCLRCFGIGVSSFPKILSFQLFGNSWTHSTSGDNNRASS